MDINKCIRSLHPCKSFLNKKVKHKDLTKILDAAHYAPSAANLQNWRFIVVQDPDTREKIARAALDQLWIAEAPLLIIICSDNSNLKSQYPKKYKKYSIEGCSAAIQNLLLQAQALNLSSCWVRTFNNAKLKILLKIPDPVEVEAIITLGYSNERPIEKKHKLEEVIFFEKYGNRTRDVSLFPLAKHLKI